MKERIRQILEWTNLSQQDFAARLGISPASLSSIFTGRTKPTNNHVQAIHRAFPEIDISWLLFGEGMMMTAETMADPLSDGNASTNKEIDGAASAEPYSMASMFPEEEYGMPVGDDVSTYHHNGNRRQNMSGRPAGFSFIDNAKKNDNRKRKIKEIRVFFDDGTYEAFVPSGNK